MPTDPFSSVVELARGWKSHFSAADRELTWLAAEQEFKVHLDMNTILVGKVDAIGRDGQGELFFGEWKTASKWGAKDWKQIWRMNPQSLSYGVLAESSYLGCRRFTVRKAFKSEPPTYDHAWFTYTPEELAYWREELKMIASEIRQYRLRNVSLPWPTNFNACFRYGAKYACPFFEPACSQLKWTEAPNGAVVQISEMREKARLNGVSPDLVILSPTAVSTWLECRERFRKHYEEGWTVPETEGDALWTGKTFHTIVGEYYQSLIPKGDEK